MQAQFKYKEELKAVLFKLKNRKLIKKMKIKILIKMIN